MIQTLGIQLYTIRDALGDDFGAAKLPAVTIGGEKRNMVSFAGGRMYVVNSTTGHPDEAIALEAFLSSGENQLKRFRERGMLPNNNTLSGHSELMKDEVMAAEY